MSNIKDFKQAKKQKNDNVIEFKKPGRITIGVTLLLVLVVLLVVLLTCFKIDNIKVTGNKHYSEKQIIEFVKGSGYVDNSILLMLKSRIKPVADIPFVAKLSIDYDGAHDITITVYEKAMAGCIEYMDRYVYFDQDGYVLEISLTKLSDAPCIKGMSFDSIELHERLPIKDKKRFKTILTLTQLIDKYKINVDSIQFTSDGDIVMQHEGIRIELGDGSLLQKQFVDLDKMLEGLDGKKGTLDMKDFDNSSGRASFKINSSK